MQYSAFSKVLVTMGLVPFLVQANNSTNQVVQPAKNGNYIVVLKSLPHNSVMTVQGVNDMREEFVESQANKVSNSLGADVHQQFHRILNGFVVKANEQQAKQLANEADVAYVEPDGKMSTMPLSNNMTDHQQDNADWGLARIVQHELSNVDGTYHYQYDGQGVTAYIVDTGINITHSDFGGRASVYVKTKIGYQQNPQESKDIHWDCNGHGTHVAGTIGGSKYGVAKDVTIVGVSVLGCSGQGDNSQVIAGLEEVLKLSQQSPQSRSVVNMSLGGAASKAVDQAVDKLVQANIPVVVAAGNKTKLLFDSLDACQVSPAQDKSAITVGATDNKDKRAGYSYLGKCTDIFAPGSNIKSDWMGSNDATNTISGTSMASPHVAGVVALYLQENPSLSPQQLKDELKQRSTVGVIDMNAHWWSPNTKSLSKNTPNNLLYALPNQS